MRNASLLMILGLSGCLAAAQTPANTSPPFPLDMGVVDLTQAPYQLDPTGQQDATAGLQQAVEDYAKGGWLLYLPAGMYVVSDAIRWRGAGTTGPQIWGQGRDLTTIRLRDGAPAFAHADQRLGILRTGSGSADNFWKCIRGLTIDVGVGNPGACGVQYMANNHGTIRDVRIRAGAGSGAVGLDVAFTDMIGPAYIRDVEISGFAIGIHAAFTVNSLVLEHIVLRDIRECGLLNEGQCLSVRDFSYVGSGPAIKNTAGPSFLVVTDADLTAIGDAAQGPAIINGSGQALLARDIQAKGFTEVIRSGDLRILTSPVVEFSSDAVSRLAPGPLHTLRLPVQSTPEVPWGDPTTWANVNDFGANPSDKDDDTQAIQRAIDSGAETVYFPHVRGKQEDFSYRISGSVILRGSLRRLIGGGGHWNTISLIGENSAACFVMGEGTPPVVIIENLNFWDLNGPGRQYLDHASSRTLVLRHCNGLLKGGPLYVGHETSGPLFMEDVSVQFPHGQQWDQATAAPLIVIAAGQQVWARQLNLEKPGTKIVNSGDLWILGYKTEATGPLIETRSGGRSELLGGLSYTSRGNPDDATMFVLREGAHGSFSIGEAGYQARFEQVVSEEHEGETRIRRRLELPVRCFGSQLTLHAAWRDGPTAKVPPAPSQLDMQLFAPDRARLTWGAASGAGSYQIYRNDEVIAETGNTVFVDTGLPDGSTLTWRVVALSTAQGAGGQATIRAQTVPDMEIPSVVRVTAYPDPARIRVTFSKPMAPEQLRDPATWILPTGTVTSVTVSDLDRVAVLAVRGYEPSAGGVLRWKPLLDQATRPNPVAINQATIEPQDEVMIHFSKDFEGQRPLAGVHDNSAWRQGKVLLQPIASGGGNHMLELKGTGFAQVELGRVALEKGRRYVVRATIRNMAGDRKVDLQLRKMEPPWTTYARQSFQLDSNQEIHVDWPVECQDSNPAAVFFLIADGDSQLFVDDLLIKDAEE